MSEPFKEDPANGHFGMHCETVVVPRPKSPHEYQLDGRKIIKDGKVVGMLFDDPAEDPNGRRQ